MKTFNFCLCTKFESRLKFILSTLLQKCHSSKNFIFQEIRKTVLGCGRLNGHVANTTATWLLNFKCTFAALGDGERNENHVE